MSFLRLGPVLIQVFGLAAVVAAEKAKDIVCSKVLPDSRSVYGWVGNGAPMNRQTWSFSVLDHPGLGINSIGPYSRSSVCERILNAPNLESLDQTWPTMVIFKSLVS